MNQEYPRETVLFRDSCLQAIWNAMLLVVCGSGLPVSGQTPVEPLRWKHQHQLETLAVLPYAPEDSDPSVINLERSRVLRVIDERLDLSRDFTPEERITQDKLIWPKNGRNVPENLHDTFQHRSNWNVYWILDGPVDGKLEDTIPCGVVYGTGMPSCGPIYKHYSADIVWYPAREQYLLVLAMSCTTEFTVAIFPVDLDKKLNVKPFDFAGKQPAEWPKPESKWPKPLAPIAELRTNLPDDICDIMAIRAVPERRLIPGEDEERNLLISAWNVKSSGADCNSVTYRYKLRERKWTRVTFDEKIEVPVKINSTGDKLLDKALEIPPEAGDPASPRNPKPLEPVPDPQSNDKPRSKPANK